MGKLVLDRSTGRYKDMTHEKFDKENKAYYTDDTVLGRQLFTEYSRIDINNKKYSFMVHRYRLTNNWEYISTILYDIAESKAVASMVALGSSGNKLNDGCSYSQNKFDIEVVDLLIVDALCHKDKFKQQGTDIQNSNRIAPNTKYCTIVRVDTDSSQRGNGIGTELMLYSLSLLFKEYKNILLECSPYFSNSTFGYIVDSTFTSDEYYKLENFYTKLGFVITDKNKNIMMFKQSPLIKRSGNHIITNNQFKVKIKITLAERKEIIELLENNN